MNFCDFESKNKNWGHWNFEILIKSLLFLTLLLLLWLNEKCWKTNDGVMHSDTQKWSFWQNSESWASEEISKLVKLSWGFLRFCVIFSAFFCEMWRKMDEGKMVENRWWRHPSGHQKMKFLTLFKMLSTSRGVKSRNFCCFWFSFFRGKWVKKSVKKWSA